MLRFEWCFTIPLTWRSDSTFSALTLSHSTFSNNLSFKKYLKEKQNKKMNIKNVLKLVQLSFEQQTKQLNAKKKHQITMMKTWHLLIETQVGDLNFLNWTFFS